MRFTRATIKKHQGKFNGNFRGLSSAKLLAEIYFWKAALVSAKLSAR
jgi:hypothetical protein